MEKFNLEKYLANPSRKVVTRDGRNAKIISTDMNCENYPIVALVQISDNYINEEVYTYTKDGEFEAEQSTKWDLFFAPEPHEGWINIFSYEKSYARGPIYNSKEEAEEIGKLSEYYSTTIKIEWEE